MNETLNEWCLKYASTIKNNEFGKLSNPWYSSHIHDEDMVCFMNGDVAKLSSIDDYLSVDLYVNPLTLSPLSAHAISYPINRLYISHDSDKYHKRTILEDIECVRQMLDKAWIAHEKQVFDTYGEPITIYVLTPVEESVLLEWYLKEEDILFEHEILPIKTKFADRKARYTTREEHLISSEEGPHRTHTRFTWGEGTNEWESWTITETWEVKTYYRGLLLETKIETRTRECND